MRSECRKDCDGVITFHKPLPPHLFHPLHTSPENVEQNSSSEEEEEEVECQYVTSATQKSSSVATRPGSEADASHTLSPSSVKHLQDQFLSERREADAIAQPLLDAENGFIRDLERFLNHRDVLSSRKRELLHKRWTECVWWPVQCSVKRRLAQGRREGGEPAKTTRAGYENYSTKVSTSPLKDPLFLYSHSRLEETRVIHHCQTGCVDAYQSMEQSRNERDLQRGCRSPGPVYIAVDDGRCFRPECWSAIGLSRSCSVKS